MEKCRYKYIVVYIEEKIYLATVKYKTIKEYNTMEDELFRKKNLDKVKSPESLDDYIKVSNPGVWLLLTSVILLLAGAIIWGIFGKIDSSVQVAVRVENKNAVCYVSDEIVMNVNPGMTIQIEDFETTIGDIGEKMEDVGYVCELSSNGSLEDGFYTGKIIIKSYKPLSFILN